MDIDSLTLDPAMEVEISGCKRSPGVTELMNEGGLQVGFYKAWHDNAVYLAVFLVGSANDVTVSFSQPAVVKVELKATVSGTVAGSAVKFASVIGHVSYCSS